MRRTKPLLLILTLALTACADWGEIKPARDFNELIPRMMSAVNKSTSPEEAAISLFDVTNPDERRDAIAYLETKPYGHEPPYMRAYEILTTDPHPMVRAQAMVALGTSHQDAAVDYLIKGVNDPEAQVRRDAAMGLAMTFGPAATKSLIEHVRGDEDNQTRINAARALRNATSPDAVRALIDAADDKDAAVAFMALGSLIPITHQNFGYDVKAWLTWYQDTYTPTTAPATAG
jgi:HEAT repeat protein